MKPPLKAILQEIRSLDPFPGVVTRVLSIAGQQEVVPAELIDVIQHDPGLTAKVLKLCNSAYYGFQREIATLEEAGNMLGVASLVNLVLTSSANKYFRDYGESSGRSLDDLWIRSITNAIASRLVAESNRTVDPERAYTAGLLQNIGSLVLDRFFQEGQRQVSAVARRGYPLIDAEKFALGVHHAEIGARLATRWDLPEVLTDTIRFHHAPDQATVDPELTATVHLAETMASAGMAGDDLTALTYEVCDAALDLTHMQASDFDAIGIELAEEMQKARDLFDM